MYDVKGHFAILTAAAVAICVMSYFTGLPHRAAPSDQGTAPIVIVPHRTTESQSAPVLQIPSVPVPRDMASLTREIQRELKRVGCYDGDLNGKWNAQSRSAMKTFTDYVNAKLPVERPDYILLRLVQGHKGKACGPTESKTLRPVSPSLLYEGRVRAPSGKVD
jgi:hypothetical protein